MYESLLPLPTVLAVCDTSRFAPELKPPASRLTKRFISRSDPKTSIPRPQFRRVGLTIHKFRSM
jgi:hypothetical protein